ncbi:MAG: transketolase family protein [Clostridia bacterium]|nr:transketolase family protein [Clostridia bacterium]
MADKIATRQAYGDALAEFGAIYPDLVVLDADLAGATKTGVFKKAFPDRFFDCGIAEGNMMCVAAGLSTTGKIPFASSFAMFAAGRAFEQVRNAIGYPHLNVKIGATHAGISVGEDGATHQCLEDIAIMRTIPGMVVINPADATEARAAVEAAIKYVGPVYLRFGRAAVPVLFDKATYKFEIGKGIQMNEGRDVTIVANGLMVEQALAARELLANEGIDAAVINMPTVKPIDSEIIINAAKKTGAIVTAEEHNIIGGLGSAVAEVVCENMPVPVVRVGTNDVFGRSGKVPPLLEMYGLTAKNICESAKKAIALKK